MGGSEQSLVTLWMSPYQEGSNFSSFSTRRVGCGWWGCGWSWAAGKVCSRGQQLTSTNTPAPTAATPNTHPSNTSHQTRAGEFWISAGKWITSSWNSELIKKSSSYCAENQSAVFCFCEVTCIHRRAQEFCPGFRAIKDALLQKKQGYLFYELPRIPWQTFKQPALRDQEIRKCSIDQKTDHDAGLTSQFICLPVWWIFSACLSNNHNSTLQWGVRHYFRYESGSLCAGNYKYHFFLWNRCRGEKITCIVGHFINSEVFKKFVGAFFPGVLLKHILPCQ